MLKTISERRADLGLSQQDLADRSGISIWTIRSWETGKRVPTIKAFRVLADALECSTDEIHLEDAGRPTDKR